MPNWCENILSVSGESASISAFRLKARGRKQTYGDPEYYKEGSWEGFDSIRVKALYSDPPELGVETELSFHSLFPIPNHIRALPYDALTAKMICEAMGVSYETSGYQWEINNWGVKWGASEVSVNEELATYLEYGFLTPWGPPELWLAKVAKDWPELTFELAYDEPGMAFGGSVQYEGGKLIYEDYNDYTESYQKAVQLMFEH